MIWHIPSYLPSVISNVLQCNTVNQNPYNFRVISVICSYLDKLI